MPQTLHQSTDQAVAPLDCRVVALTHSLPPYMASVLLHTAKQIREFQVLLSVEREPNRQFARTWNGLNVKIQKSWMFKRLWTHRKGFKDELYVHVPFDTIVQLRRACPDIVFSYELGFRSLTSALYCKLYRKKLALCVCVSEHTEQGRGFVRQLVRRVLLRSADSVTYNGPSCLRYLKRFDVPDEKLFFFPYASSDSFQYKGLVERAAEADYRLLCIGQLTERKGVVPMLDSLAEYCKARPEKIVEIDFIGTGKLEAKLQETPLPSNLKMRLLGHLPYEGISQAMEQAGVLIFPTLADEWGLVVNEALQAGMPVIGSEYSQACTTLVRDGETGWIYNPDDPNQLWHKLDQMYAVDHASLLRMRHCAQASVSEITSERVAANAIQMFRMLMQDSNNDVVDKKRS